MIGRIGLSNNRRGQSLVEFALILPLLLFLVMGIIQFGFILSGYVTVSNAAREGARVGIIEKTDASIISKVNEAFDSSPYLSNPSIVITFPEGGGYTNGEPVSVEVTGDVLIMVPLLDEIFPANIFQVSRTSVMMVEGFIDD